MKQFLETLADQLIMVFKEGLIVVGLLVLFVSVGQGIVIIFNWLF